MISRLGLAISRVFHKVCPDPFVIAILLTAITAVLALAFGVYPPEANGVGGRAAHLLDAWRADDGLWKLLGFAMQMCLILVTGHALASTRPVRAIILRFAGQPSTTGGAATMVAAVACLAGLINWGLGLIVGALMAREVGRSFRARGLPLHYPLLAAAGYMGLLVFHGGLSASAPLSSTTVKGASKVLPPSAVELIGDGIGLERTLFSPLNLFVTGGLLVLVPALFRLLSPRNPNDMLQAPETQQEAQAKVVGHDSSELLNTSIPDRLERSPLVVCLIAVPLLLAVARYMVVNGLWNVDLNQINALMLALGLLLHGSPRAYAAAVEDGARDCGSIIIQFPIYAGIMAMMKGAGLVELLTNAFIKIANAESLPVLSFFAATLVGLFVPSGGAQWGLQGEITLRSAEALGVDPGVMLMSVAYGDELANMLQPFWALPLLAITGVRARDIVGYTAIAMLVAGLWMALGLWIF